MNVSEIRIRKQALERDLKRLISEFEEETGTCVEAIELGHSTDFFYVASESVAEVSCKVVVR
jgi:ATP-dependent protease ClpP protease subunit